MACSHTSTCPLFPLISVNSALKVWKTFYCEGNFNNCARFNMSKTGQSVPANLLPNGKTLTAKGMANESTTPEEKVKAVQAAGNEIVQEMASIELDEPAEVEAVSPAIAAVAKASAPAVENFEASGDTNSWYLRIMFSVDSGVVANVIQALGKHRVKIDAMAEKRQSGSQVKMVLVILTDQVSDDALTAAVLELKTIPSVVGNIKKIKLEYLSPDMFK